jgi:hypothetical protein
LNSSISTTLHEKYRCDSLRNNYDLAIFLFDKIVREKSNKDERDGRIFANPDYADLYHLIDSHIFKKSHQISELVTSFATIKIEEFNELITLS